MRPENSPDNIAEDWRITAYAFNQLEGEELAAFEAQLRSDPRVQQAVEQTAALVGQMREDAVLLESGMSSLSTDRHSTIAAAFDASAPSKPPHHDVVPPAILKPAEPSGNGRSIAAILALAAAVSLALVWGYRRNVGPLAQGDQTQPSAMEKALRGPETAAAMEETELPRSPSIQPNDSEEVAEAAAPFPLLRGAPAMPTERLPPNRLSAYAPALELPAAGTVDQLSASRGEGKQPDAGFESSPDAYGSEAYTAGAGYGNAANSSPLAPKATAASGAGGMGGGYGPLPSSESGVEGYAAAGAYPRTLGAPVSDDTLQQAGEGQSGEGRSLSSGLYSRGRRAQLGLTEERLAQGLQGEGQALEGQRAAAATPAAKPAAGDLAYEMSPGTSSVPHYREVPELRQNVKQLWGDRWVENPAGDAYAPIVENGFLAVAAHPLSTFAIDVDTASYSKIRMLLQQYGSWPDPDAVRIEEMVNYFDYDYPQPEGEDIPFAAAMEVATCPWNSNHRLARVAIQGREIENADRAVSNLVFLLDVSGSMNEPQKLPLVRRGLEMLVRELGENDRVAIVVYAGAAGLVLDSTTGDQQETILAALDRLQAGGSTNGGQGIQLAYEVARDHFISGGTNRVILCTDGDFNVGTTGTESLVEMVAREAKGGIFLSVLGYGTGNLNDAMLEAISGRGDGNYAFIDSDTEARKVLVDQMAGTLVTIAKDVKVQVEFNPARVESFRLIGYENRLMPAKDFNDDTKDAGEIGAGHTVTALYEIVPAGAAAQPSVDQLRYQPRPEESTSSKDAEFQDELLLLKIRYRSPEGGPGRTLDFPIVDRDLEFKDASDDFRFASAVAGFGMLLRRSQHAGDATLDSIRAIAREAIGSDARGLRSDFIGLVDAARQLPAVR